MKINRDIGRLSVLLILLFAFVGSFAQEPSAPPTGNGDSSKPRPRGVSSVMVQQTLSKLRPKITPVNKSATGKSSMGNNDGSNPKYLNRTVHRQLPPLAATTWTAKSWVYYSEDMGKPHNERRKRIQLVVLTFRSGNLVDFERHFEGETSVFRSGHWRQVGDTVFITHFGETGNVLKSQTLKYDDGVLSSTEGDGDYGVIFISDRIDNWRNYEKGCGQDFQDVNVSKCIEGLTKGVSLFPSKKQYFVELRATIRGESSDPAASKTPDFAKLCREYSEDSYGQQAQRAVDPCLAAVQLDPGDGRSQFHLAVAYSRLGKTDDAKKHYSLANDHLNATIYKNPRDSDAFYLLGNVAFGLDQPLWAIEYYKKAIELNPRLAKARYNLGIIQILNRNKVAAQEQYNALVAIDAGLAAKLKAEIDRY